MSNQNGMFKCIPAEYCNDCGPCCSSPHIPELTLGDYSRLSNFLGITIEEIWSNVGDASTHYVGMPPTERGWNSGLYTGNLGIVHNPCQYLKDQSCEVNPVKPINCRIYPEAFLGSVRAFGGPNFLCLNNKRLGNSETIADLRKLLHLEQRLSNGILFDGSDLYIDLYQERILLVDGSNPIELDIPDSVIELSRDYAIQIAHEFLTKQLGEHVFGNEEDIKARFAETTEEYIALCGAAVMAES